MHRKKNATANVARRPLFEIKTKKYTTYDVTLFTELGNKPRWKTNRPTGDIVKEAVHLKSPVARILLANYEVIGKLSRRGTRLAALYLITSNKRYSPPLLFLLPFFSSPPLFSLPLSLAPSVYSFYLALPFPAAALSLSFALSFQRAANVFTCVVLKRLISLAMSPVSSEIPLCNENRYRPLSVCARVE